MKKLILITTGVVMFSMASFAQVDSTKRDKTQTQPTQQPQSDQMRNTDDFKGWSTVQSTDIPANLRTTLGGNKYKGWESGTIYRNEAGDSYALRTTGANPQTYYFDKNGKPGRKPRDN